MARIATMHFVYIDGSKDNKLACFSALLVPVETWNDCLNRLISIRRIIKRAMAEPPSQAAHEGHIVGYQNGLSDQQRRYYAVLSAGHPDSLQQSALLRDRKNWHHVSRPGAE